VVLSRAAVLCIFSSSILEIDICYDLKFPNLVITLLVLEELSATPVVPHHHVIISSADGLL